MTLSIRTRIQLTIGLGLALLLAMGGSAIYGNESPEARVSIACIGVAASVALVLIGRAFVREAQDRDQTHIELETTVAELHKALESIRTLNGLLPICSGCKKIRDDSGYWERVETYVTQHTHARFSHGVCPECFPKYYPDLPYEEEDRLTV